MNPVPSVKLTAVHRTVFHLCQFYKDGLLLLLRRRGSLLGLQPASDNAVFVVFRKEAMRGNGEAALESRSRSWISSSTLISCASLNEVPVLQESVRLRVFFIVGIPLDSLHLVERVTELEANLSYKYSSSAGLEYNFNHEVVEKTKDHCMLLLLLLSL